MLSVHKLGPKGVEYYVSYAGRGAEGYWLGESCRLAGACRCGRPGGVPCPRERRAPRRGSAVGTRRHRPHAGLGLHAVGAEISIARLGTRRRTAAGGTCRGASRGGQGGLLVPRGRGRPGTARVRGPRRARYCGARRRLLRTPGLACGSTRSSIRMGLFATSPKEATGDGPRSTPA